MALMLDDLLTISKGEELKEFNPELTDFQALTRSTVQDISEGAGTTHKFNFMAAGRLQQHPHRPEADPAGLSPTCSSNAVKYSPAGQYNTGERQLRRQRNHP